MDSIPWKKFSFVYDSLVDELGYLAAYGGPKNAISLFTHGNATSAARASITENRRNAEFFTAL